MVGDYGPTKKQVLSAAGFFGVRRLGRSAFSDFSLFYGAARSLFWISRRSTVCLYAFRDFSSLYRLPPSLFWISRRRTVRRAAFRNFAPSYRSSGSLSRISRCFTEFSPYFWISRRDAERLTDSCDELRAATHGVPDVANGYGDVPPSAPTFVGANAIAAPQPL